MNIFLGDLGHYTVKLTNNFAPINIGYISAYAKKLFGDEVDIQLFRDPEKLWNAVRREPPTVLALSNYVWCQSVSENILRHYKTLKPNGCAVWGGPNFPMNEMHKAGQYLVDRPFVDFYIPFEGEIPFSNIIKALLGCDEDINNLKVTHPESFEGSFFVTEDGELIGNGIGVQIPHLDTIPSPYLDGWMDEFIRDGIHPLMETHRGCPYLCTFCHTGLNYYNRGRTFSLERCIDEVEYIVKRVPDPRAAQLHLTDANFGMWDQDYEFIKYLADLYEKTGFPLKVAATTGKGRAEHVIKTVMTHPKLTLTNSVQSLDKEVLTGIKRRNLPIEKLKLGARELEENGKISGPEVILGLPRESRQSHIQTMRKLMTEIEPSIIYQYTLMLLPGTEIYTDEMRKEHQYMVRYRIIPTAFGEYAGERTFEIEEVSVSTKDLRYEEYLEMRALYFVVMNLYSNIIYKPLVRYLLFLKIDIVEFFLYLIRTSQNTSNVFAKDVLTRYMHDTEHELFNTKEELIEHYSKDENYDELIQGREGKNLSHTFRTECLINADEWAAFITGIFCDYVRERQPSSEASDITRAISTHILVQAKCQSVLFRDKQNIPSMDNPLTSEIAYNIPSIFKTRIDKETNPIILRQRTTLRYFMRDDAIRYITSLKKEMGLIEFALIVLRMDVQYIFPICEVTAEKERPAEAKRKTRAVRRGRQKSRAGKVA